ncbi:MAG: pseudouridine synthase [Patescibacteria group bacterium]
MTLIRLNKFLSEKGVASRRAAEQLILSGRIKVNGEIVHELGTKVDPDADKVFFNHELVSGQARQQLVIMLNKPVGYVSTVRKFPGEKNVLELVKTEERIYPAGRLDKDSTGLLILTNDGDLALKLMHPRYEKEKEYMVEVDHAVDSGFLKKMSSGVWLEDGQTLPAKTKRVSTKVFSIVLREGRKRQIRRMCESFQFKVVSLKRVRINKLLLGSLAVGKYKVLSEKEIELLKN